MYKHVISMPILMCMLYFKGYYMQSFEVQNLISIGTRNTILCKSQADYEFVFSKLSNL